MPSCNRADLKGCYAVDVGDYWNPTFKETYEDTDAEGNTIDVPFDFTGYTVRMRVRATKSGVDLLTLSEVGDDQTTGIYFSDKTTGEFQAIIMGADSLPIAEGEYLYEIGVTDPIGNETVFLNGKIVFNEVFN